MEKNKTFIYRALAYLTAMALIANIGFFEAKFVKSFNNTISLTAEAWGVSTYAILDDNGNLSIRNRNVMVSGSNLIEENGGTYDLKSIYSLPNDCGISNLLTVDNEWSSLSGDKSPVKTVTVDDEISPTNISGLFQDFANLENADLTNVDTANVDDASMSNVFEDCSALDTLTLGENFGNSEQTLSILGLDSIITGWTKRSENDATDYASSKISLGVADTYSAVTYCYATVMGGHLRIYQRKHIQTDEGTVYSWRSGSGKSGYTTCEGGRPPKDANGDIRKNWSNFGTDSIKKVDVVDSVKPLSLNSWFRECRNVTNGLNIDNLDTSDAVSMAYMFYDCNKPTEYDLRHFNTSKVEDMSYMFAKCWSLKTVYLSSFDTSNVTDMTSMFDMRPSSSSSTLKSVLKKIYASDSFVVKEGTTTTNMFAKCVELVGGSGTAFSTSYIDGEYARIDGRIDGKPGYFTEENATYDLLKEEKENGEEITSIDFDFLGIDENIDWWTISEHDDQMPRPNEDYLIGFDLFEPELYALPDTIEVIIDGTVYNVAVSGENAEGEPTFANGILTIPAELLTEETKSLVITASAVEIVEQEDEEKTDEEKTDEPSEEQNPTEKTEDKKEDITEETTPKDEETETDKSDDTSKDNTTSGGEADKETDTVKPTEDIKQTFDIDITEIENADIKGKDGKALSAENLLDEDGNAILVITADKDHAIPQSFNITIGNTEYTIDTTKAEQTDGIVWEADTGTLTIPKDLLNGENVEIGVKLQAILKEDEDEEKTDKPDEGKNPDNSGNDTDNTDNKNDENTSGGTEEEKPKDDTTDNGENAEGGNTDTDTENDGNTDTENGGTTDNDGNTENGEQKPSDDVTDNGDNDTTDTPTVPPETDGDKKDDTDSEDNEGNNNECSTTVPPDDTEGDKQPPSEEKNEGEEKSDNQDKVDSSDSSDNSSSTDNDVSTDTESGSNAPLADGNTSNGSTDSKDESSDTENSSSSNDNSGADSSSSSAPTTSTNTPNNSVAAPSTDSNAQGGESSSSSSPQGSSSDGGASGGNGGNNSTNSSTTTSANTPTTKKKTETSGTTDGDSSDDSN